MRIIAGKYKGKKLESLPGKIIRPTLGKAREALFNILTHGDYYGEKNSPFIGKYVLDLFCGTGALGFEALSRGAKHVIFIDENSKALEVVEHNAKHLHADDNITIIRSDSTRAPKAHNTCGLIMLDPPYFSGLALPAIQNLDNKGWINEDTIIAAEQSKKENHPIIPGFSIIDERVYNATRIVLFKKNI